MKELDDGMYKIAMVKSRDEDLFSVYLYSKVTMKHVFWTEETDIKQAERTYRQFKYLAE